MPNNQEDPCKQEKDNLEKSNAELESAARVFRNSLQALDNNINNYEDLHNQFLGIAFGGAVGGALGGATAGGQFSGAATAASGGTAAPSIPVAVVGGAVIGSIMGGIGANLGARESLHKAEGNIENDMNQLEYAIMDYSLASKKSNDAKKDLEHCQKEQKSKIDGEQGMTVPDDGAMSYEDDTSYEDEDLLDFLDDSSNFVEINPPQEDDENFVEDDGTNIDLSSIVICPECGEEVILGDFERPNDAGDAYDIECPYCETEFVIEEE